MKKAIVNVLKYIGIFVFMVAGLLALLTLTAKIPKASIKENIVESLQFFKDNRGVELQKSRKEYKYLHCYADSILLNMIYGIDTSKPLSSVLEAKYYETIRTDSNEDFIYSVENDLEVNQEYLRYWHGSTAILRPLLVFFNVDQIYAINKVLLFLLAIVLFVMLFKRSIKLAIIYAISLVMITFMYVPMCFEFTWTFYVMFITSIIAILIEKRGNSGLYKLFFISGIVTCYLDFLSTETITVLIPVVFVLYMRNKENRIKFKDAITFVVISCALWLVAYALMWVAKWLIAAAVLKIDVMQFVKEEFFEKFNGWDEGVTSAVMHKEVLLRNIKTLYPIHIMHPTMLTVVTWMTIAFLAIFTDWKNISKKWFALIMVLISLVPYVRYFVLTFHSYYHSFFTFRAQIISIIGIGIAVLECLNYKLLFKDLKSKNKVKNIDK